ncbi:MAG: hypothetical protein WCF68_03985 [Terriglobales bacterium]
MKFDEIFHAEVTFRADVTAVEQRLSLVIADGVDGWVGAVHYPDTKESITVCQEPEIEDAKANVEGWVRTVHGVKDAIKWAPGAASLPELKADC